MMKKIIFCYCIASLGMLFACQESIEDRAAREAKEYTMKMCPSPIVNNTRVDSLTFDYSKRRLVYYYTLCNECDTMAFIERCGKEVSEGLKKTITNDPNVRGYRDAGISFEYVVRSQKHPEMVMLRVLVDE